MYELDILLKLLSMAGLAAAIAMSVSVVRYASRTDSRALKRCREEIKTLRELLKSRDQQIESLKREHEAKMRELHERIAMLEALDKAIRSGKVRLVEIETNEECRILVDGTVICGDHVLRV